MNTKYVLQTNLSGEELKKEYATLREQIQCALYYMDQSLYYLKYINNDLFNIYNVDNEKISSIEIEKMKEVLKQRTNYLRYTTLPEIQRIENSL